MSALEQAIEGEQWEFAALCLALGLLRALDQLLPDALPEILELLSEHRGSR